jgi:mannose-1-phosphate guanylyltransferase
MDKTLKNHLNFLILCGGGGTRLWPRSREQTPKQFIKLFGKKSLFLQTLERIKPLVPYERIYIVTLEKYIQQVKKEDPKILTRNIISEPFKRNTAAAMGLGTVYIGNNDKDAIVVNLAADHVIKDVEEFQKVLLAAAKAATLGDYLVSVGINPTFPHTGLGYIKIGKEIKRINHRPIFKVLGFTEKPKLGTAKAFVASHQYFWNANYYTWTVKSALNAFRKHEPSIYKNLLNIQKKLSTPDQKKKIREVYQVIKEIQIDYAISEKAKNLILIPGDFGWQDIGDWKVVYEISPKDKGSNVFIKSGEGGKVLEIETRDSLVHFDDQLIAVIGVKDLIIVDTKDALLVCPKDRAQEVKKIVNLLKEKKYKKFL